MKSCCACLTLDLGDNDLDDSEANLACLCHAAGAIGVNSEGPGRFLAERKETDFFGAAEFAAVDHESPQGLKPLFLSD
jgi:hypothetical protein